MSALLAFVAAHSVAFSGVAVALLDFGIEVLHPDANSVIGLVLGTLKRIIAGKAA